MASNRPGQGPARKPSSSNPCTPPPVKNPCPTETCAPGKQAYRTPEDAYGARGRGLGSFKPKRSGKLFASVKCGPKKNADEGCNAPPVPPIDPCSPRTSTQPFAGQLNIGDPIPFKRISEPSEQPQDSASASPFLQPGANQGAPGGAGYPSSPFPYPPTNTFNYPVGGGGAVQGGSGGASDISKSPVNLQFSVHGGGGGSAAANQGVISLTVSDSGGQGSSRSKSGSVGSIGQPDEDAVVALPLSGAFKVSTPGTLPAMEGNYKISSPKTAPKIEGRFNISGVGGSQGNLAGEFSVNLPVPNQRRMSAGPGGPIISGANATYNVSPAGAAGGTYNAPPRDEARGSGRTEAGAPRCDATFDAGPPRYDGTFVSSKLRPQVPNVGPCGSRAMPRPTLSPYDAPPASSSQARAMRDLMQDGDASFIGQPSSAVLRGIPTSGLPNIGDDVPPTPAGQRLPETPALGYNIPPGMSPDVKPPFFKWQKEYVEMLERVIVEDPELQKIRAQYQVPALFGQQNIGVQQLPLTAGKPGIAVPADSSGDSSSSPWCAEEISGIEPLKPPCDPECCPKVIQVIGFVGITEPN